MTLQEQHTITDKQAIRKALCAPAVMPDSFLDRKLIPIGMSKYRGDSLPMPWTNNKHFLIGNQYPVYDNEGQLLTIGSDGVGKKFLTNSWTKVKLFN